MYFVKINCNPVRKVLARTQRRLNLEQPMLNLVLCANSLCGSFSLLK